MSNKRVFFQIVLPISHILLAFFLLTLGRSEMVRELRIAKSEGGIHEPLPSYIERARYVSYAINAPAWFVQLLMPSILHLEGSSFWGGEGAHLGAIEDERDFWYLVFVGVLWFFVGRKFDRRRRQHRAAAESYIISLLLLLAAGLLVAAAISPPFGSELWFKIAVCVWALGLAGFGLSILIQDRFIGKGSEWPR